MELPLIAIIGRPNVGKSRLFNRLIGRYKALVDDQSGVTRDRHYAIADWAGKPFRLVDTGGLIPGTLSTLNKKVWEQAFQAIKEAQAVICVFDGLEGITPLDESLVQELRTLDKPIFFAVNKIDVASHEKNVFEFTKFGIEPVFGVSAEHGRGVSDLLEAISEKIASGEIPKIEKENVVRLGLIGRPNAGKSTLLNWFAKEERSIVHEAPGTTRDAVDIVLQRREKKYIFIDTAGFKRKNQTKTRLEKFSVVATFKVIQHCDIVLYLLDALEGLTHHDLYLLNEIWKSRKGLILIINKWDLMKIPPPAYLQDFRPQLRYLQNIPILCISAKEGKRCLDIWPMIDKVFDGMQKKFPTAQLNRWLEAVVMEHPLPNYRGRDVKLNYGTQVAHHPPHFVFFTNEPKGIPESYRRYMEHQMTDALNLEGVPIGISFRKKW